MSLIQFHFGNTFVFQNLLKDEAALKIPASSSYAFVYSCPGMLACVAKAPNRSRYCLVAITPLPANRFPNKLTPNVPNNILKNCHFSSFASFLIVSLTHFINKPDSSGDFFH